MEKLILKKIAKDWSKNILLGCDNDSFSDIEKEGKLSEEEISYIVSETHKIAERITPNNCPPSIDAIIDSYYIFEEQLKEKGDE